MRIRPQIRRWLALGLVVVLGVGQFTPLAFAASPSPMTNVADEHAGHAMSAMETSNDGKVCMQADQCDGLCCVLCGHCLSVAPPVDGAAANPHVDIRTPVVPRLHSITVVSVQIRPPQ